MKIYRCEYCNYSVLHNKTKKGVHSPKYMMGKHYEDKHKKMLPPDWTGYRWFYYKLTGKERGSCVICHNDTEFNEISMKYSRFCNNPMCKQKYKEERDRRMIAKYGKLYLLDDPEQQKKMQQGRSIAGTYTYRYKDKNHFYMPDVFIPSMNLEIEIKSSVRMEKQNEESREKEIIKDKLMKSCSNLINYIIIYDKNYDEFNKIIQKEEG